MDSRSKHLSGENRGVILVEDLRGSSKRVIGTLLERSASTICRELARGRQDIAPIAHNRHGWLAARTRLAVCILLAPEPFKSRTKLVSRHQPRQFQLGGTSIFDCFRDHRAVGAA